MGYRQILPMTDPLLRTQSAPVTLVDGKVPDPILTLAEDLLATTRAVNGAGMAAVQVGVPVRLFLMDLIAISGDTIVFINPEIIERAEKLVTRKEGCLSMPGGWVEIERPDWVVVRYIGLDGAEHEYRATGMASVCVQHEIDHLDGIRNIDRLSPLKRARALKAFQKSRTRPREK